MKIDIKKVRAILIEARKQSEYGEQDYTRPHGSFDCGVRTMFYTADTMLMRLEIKDAEAKGVSE